MRRLTCIAVLSIVFAYSLPAAAHVPQHCEPLRGDVYNAYVKLQEVSEWLAPDRLRLLTREGIEEIIGELIIAHAGALAADIKMTECIEGREKD